MIIKYQWIKINKNRPLVDVLDALLDIYRSVFQNYQAANTRLEAYTERSESNPGQGLGTKLIGQMAVWKTVPYECRI